MCSFDSTFQAILAHEIPLNELYSLLGQRLPTGFGWIPGDSLDPVFPLGSDEVIDD